MNKQISFTKMVAAGNDFVVIDNRKKVVTGEKKFARTICDRHTGVGADGLLLVEKVEKGDYRVRVLNSDGSEAEACGNGFRCISRFAHEKLGFGKRQQFESLSGSIQAEVNGRKVRVRLADPKNVSGKETVEVSGRTLHYYAVNTGVPHAVIFVEGLAKIPVAELGRAVRFHSRFQPAGTNVNFVEVTGPQSISVRTYERGVEAETLACGTGSSASAIVSARLGYVKPPVQVKTSGGEILTVFVGGQARPGQVQDVYLEGEAKIVFEGTWKEKR